jgi:thiol-disulfide isomerase/thioredoxin
VKYAVVGLALVALAGCNEKRTEPVSSSRYEAVKAVADPSTRWCDTRFTGAAPRLSLPALAPAPAGRSQAALPKGKRAWVNLWATWCQPCLREMPLLLKWQQELHKDGVDAEIFFLSLDEDADVFAKFLAEHKEFATAKVGRAASQSDYEEWVKGFVADPATPIPIHLLGSADGNLRCVRSGSLREGDYPAAKAVLR